MFEDPAYRALVSRGKLLEYDATGSQHLARISGLKGEELTGVVRLQQFGQSSSPPIGSHVVFVRMGGASERATILGIDHADYGPRDLAAGEKAVFDKAGNEVRLANGGLTVKGASKVTVSVGGMTVTVTGSRVDLGGSGGSPVMTLAGPSSKVFAVL